jgi:hypothetical protein
MIFQRFRRASLAAAIGCMFAGAAGSAVQGAEPRDAVYWRASYSNPSNDWRAAKRTTSRVPHSKLRSTQPHSIRAVWPERLESEASCVTLSCPGYILLGVGF